MVKGKESLANCLTHQQALRRPRLLMRGSGTRWVSSPLRDQRFALSSRPGLEEMDKPRAILSAAVLSAVVGVTLGAATVARAQDCPGHPDAIGTSRVITIDPGES